MTTKALRCNKNTINDYALSVYARVERARRGLLFTRRAMAAKGLAFRSAFFALRVFAAF